VTAAGKREVPVRYEIRIDGHLEQHWAAWFGDLALSPDGDGTTKLCGLVPDQAALYGVLTKVRDLGMVLISVQAVELRDGPDQGA
jgi:hypothetical protein